MIIIDVSENDEDFDLRMEEGGRAGKLRKHGREKMPPLVAVIGGNTEVRINIRLNQILTINQLLFFRFLGLLPNIEKHSLMW